METKNLTNGADKFTGTDLADNIYGKEGDDVIDGGAGNDNLRGGEGSDTLYGGEGNDFIDGGEGADKMIGGVGNDTYVVNDSSDVVIEDLTGGIDTVKSWIDYTLRPNVENLELQGSDDLNGSGNSLNNTIKGNGGNNSLSGGAGNDSLSGGTGNDVLLGGEGNDYLDGGEGMDLVSYKDAAAAVTIDLSKEKQVVSGAGQDTIKNVENLEGSSHSDILTGNGLDNKILGLEGDDVIRGGAGNDQLFGGDGADRFVFNTASVNGVDYIRDFTSGSDKLVFYTADGYDADALFTVNLNGAAEGSGPQFIFDANSHSLSYDADGAGAQAATVLAHFAPATVVWGDILIG